MHKTFVRASQVAFASALAASLVPANAAQVGYWSFDEASGTTILDSSGSGNNGVLINGDGAHVSGKLGNALYFRGVTGSSSTRVSIADSASLDLSSAASFAAWIKPDSVYIDAPIFAKEGPLGLAYLFGNYGPSFGVLLDSDGSQPWTYSNRSQGHIAANKWTFLTATWDGSVVRYFQDGELVNALAFSGGPLHNSAEALVIGANGGYNFTAFHGVIDEARIFNNALTGDEVRALYALAPSVPEPVTSAMMLAGLGVVGAALRRRGRSGPDRGCSGWSRWP